MAPVDDAAEMSPAPGEVAPNSRAPIEPVVDAADDEEVLVDPAPAWQADESGFTSSSGKRVCREMDSCAEANFFLNQCGVGRLDGDGVPRESIC